LSADYVCVLCIEVLKKFSCEWGLIWGLVEWVFSLDFWVAINGFDY